MRFIRQFLMTICLLALFTACGSGNSNSDDNETTDPANQEPTPEENTGEEFTATFTLESIPDYTPVGDPIYLVGSFNSWQLADPDYQFEINDSGQYELQATFDSDTLIEYKFNRGTWDTVEKDADGKEVQNRTFTPGSVDAITDNIANWADFIEEVIESTIVGEVVVIEDFDMPQFATTRRISIYLPADYRTANKRYPVLYMHDGQNVFDGATSFAGEWQVDETLESLFAAGESDGLIVVAVDNSPARYEEYSPWIIEDINGETRGGEGDMYARFLVDSLKPYIDQNFRTRIAREYTGIAGSSMGGLISLYVGLSEQTTFSKIGAFSPYISTVRIGQQVHEFVEATEIDMPMDIYLDIGSEEIVRQENQPLITAVEEINALLIAKNAIDSSIRFELVDGAGHNEPAWASRFGDVITWLFPYGLALDETPSVVDTDLDGIPDEVEALYDFLDENNPDDAQLDEDEDGLSNLEELVQGSLPDDADTDDDGLPDGVEFMNMLDMLTSGDESLDKDLDGLSNLDEFLAGTNISDSDTDNDGVDDGQDAYPLDPEKQQEPVEPMAQLKIMVIYTPENTPSDDDIFMTNSSNNWELGSEEFKLEKNGQGHYVLELDDLPVGEIEFKFNRGTWASVETDLVNSNLGNHVVSVTETPQVFAYHINRWADLPADGASTVRGNVVIHENIDIPQLNRKRNVRVYLPPEYDTSGKAYPVLYMYDAQNLFDIKLSFNQMSEWEVDETLDKMFYEGKTDGVIVVGVDNSMFRGCEYNPFENDIHPFCGDEVAHGDLMNEFIVTTLKPFIDSEYRTKSDRDNTFIGGSSMGGQMSMKMGLDYQDVFSAILAVSPSYQNELFNPFNMPGYIGTVGKSFPIAIYQDMGTAEQVRNIDADKLVANMQAVDTALESAGFANRVVVIDEGAEHNESAWAKRFPAIMDWLFSLK